MTVSIFQGLRRINESMLTIIHPSKRLSLSRTDNSFKTNIRDELRHSDPINLGKKRSSEQIQQNETNDVIKLNGANTENGSSQVSNYLIAKQSTSTREIPLETE